MWQDYQRRRLQKIERLAKLSYQKGLFVLVLHASGRGPNAKDTGMSRCLQFLACSCLDARTGREVLGPRFCRSGERQYLQIVFWTSP